MKHLCPGLGLGEVRSFRYRVLTSSQLRLSLRGCCCQELPHGRRSCF